MKTANEIMIYSNFGKQRITTKLHSKFHQVQVLYAEVFFFRIIILLLTVIVLYVMFQNEPFANTEGQTTQ